MRRPVPESAGTAGVRGFSGGAADGLGSAVAVAFGGVAAATGLVPWSAWTARTATTAIAPVVSPVTQAHEGRRADTGTHSSATDSGSDHPTASGRRLRSQSRTGSSSGRWPSEA